MNPKTQDFRELWFIVPNFQAAIQKSMNQTLKRTGKIRILQSLDNKDCDHDPLG